MKVVFVIPKPVSLFLGGMELQVFETKRALEKCGVQVDFLSYSDPKAFDGVDLVHFFHIFYGFSELSSILCSKKIPYVISTVFYRIENPVKVVLRRKLAKIPYTRANLEKYMLDNAAALITASKSETIKIYQYYEKIKNRVYVIPLGVDPNFVGNGQRFYQDNLRDFIRNDSPFVLHVARTEPVKNTLRLIQATIKEDLPLVIIGPENRNFPGYCDKVRTCVEQYSSRIRRFAAVEPKSTFLADAYNAARVHALPSIWETTGLASLEAGINGANLVVGHCPPVLEYFQGIAEFCNSHDIIDIAKALRVSINKKRDSYNQSEVIKRLCGWDNIAEKILMAYRNIVQTN